MPKTKQQKQEIGRDLKERLAKAKSVVFTSFNALTVKENELIRIELGKEQSEYYATKKTLLDRALKDANIEVDARNLEGQVAITFGYADEVAPAKIISKFVKDFDGRVKFLGGVLEGKFIDAAGITALASLPSKEQLYAQLVGSINAPVSGFVNVLAGNLRSLVHVLSAIQETK
ncbi:MAG: 50S ribosomal protein L10 [Candidatus Falkowbacteria bacterium]|nr:50S ribosomal protein L10 [Candidatus Falkowbacteria bacterium]